MRFICDAMLGKLAKYLRLLGLDAVYIRPSAPWPVADDGEETCFVTRRRSPTGCRRTIRVGSDNAIDQLREIRGVIRPLIDDEKALARCIKCNVVLETVGREEIEAVVPEYVFHRYLRFTRCRTCGRVYWEGSHVENIRRAIKEVFT